MVLPSVLNNVRSSSFWTLPWRRTRDASIPLPLYSPIVGSEADGGNHNAEARDSLHRAQRHGDDDYHHPLLLRSNMSSQSGKRRRPRTGLPSLSRFLSDVTLGFADGLTVPFALTAGLSSLGQTDTVIYAGLAEICAGSLSMGIGGYLSARGEYAEAVREMQRADEERKRATRGVVAAGNHDNNDNNDNNNDSNNNDEDGVESLLSDNATEVGGVGENDGPRDEDVGAAAVAATAAAATGVADPGFALREKSPAEAAREKRRSQSAEARGLSPATATYLALLDLPPHLMDRMAAHVLGRPDVYKALEAHEAAARAAVSEKEEDGRRSEQGKKMCAPMLSGLSVAVGYLVGGALPLFPYFLVNHVGDGLKWSFVVCLAALFAFGFAKDFVLSQRAEASSQAAAARDSRMADEEAAWGVRRGRGGARWKAIRHSIWEGTQMALLGGAAALVAVLCVRAFEGMNLAGDGGTPQVN